MKLRTLVFLGAAMLAAPAYADDPTPDQIDLAKKILISVGLKASMDEIVPAMLNQLETLVALLPEFQSGEADVFTDTSKVLASRLNTDELKQTLTYFDSPAGKKYTQAQAPILEMLASSGGLWREKLTKIIVDRTREEMKKKGFEF
jgi:hypothetical protein